MTTAKMVVMLRKELNLFEEHIHSTANLDVYAGRYISQYNVGYVYATD